MGKPTGFIEIQRKKHPTRPIEERIHDWREVYLPSPTGDLMEQGARCMETFETNVPNLFIAGGAIAGKKTGNIFIENGRFHGQKIVETLAKRLRGD